MKINEIFFSIQGEGKFTGLPNIFIRTTGCNLRCNYCDTKYAYTKGVEKTDNQIISEIEKYKCKNICITGGEPLEQKKETITLINNLLEKKYKIIIETNGSIDITDLPKNQDIIISLDIKCPSSEMHEKMNFENINFLEEKDQLKFVIKDKTDFEYAKEIIQKYNPNCEIFFQPVWDEKPEKLAKWILNDNLNVKLGLQLHKILDMK